MEIQNLVRAVISNNNIESNDMLSKLKVGDSLKAKVISIASDVIMLQVNDRLTISAKDLSAIHYREGDLVDFTVTDIEEGKIFIKSNISKLALLESKLSEMGVKLNESNKDLIELLIKNQIPITKENITAIQSTRDYYEKMAEIIKENNVTINSDTINNNIKDSLKNLIQIRDYSPSNNDNRAVQKNSNQINPFNISVEGNNNVLMTKASESNNISNREIPFAQDFLNNENKASLEKLVFMLKNNLDFSPKDIILVDNLLAGKKTLTNQIEGLIKLVDEELVENKGNNSIKDTDYQAKDIFSKDIKKTLVTLLNKFQMLDFKEDGRLSQAFKELYEGLEEIKASIANSESNSLIGKTIEEIKASLDFINRLNENMAFIQIPLNMNGAVKNLDIFIRKENKSRKKIDSSNAKLFISLNTNNLDLVQVLIELKEKEINLNFKVSNEKIKGIIKNNEELLSSKLEEQGFSNVMFKYNISTEKQDITDSELFEGNKKLNTLDLRV